MIPTTRDILSGEFRTEGREGGKKRRGEKGL